MSSSSANARPVSPTAEADPIALAKHIAPLADAEAQRSEEAGTLSPAVVKALKEAGLYWIFIPKSMGGFGNDITTGIRVIEELSRADASTGWSVMATSVATLGPAVYGSDALAERMFGNGKRGLVAGQFGIGRGHIEPVDGGYRFGGNFGFASGSDAADWICAGVVPIEGGQPKKHPNGFPYVAVAYFPREQVKFTGNWNVFGLEGTGSYDYVVEDQFVPTDYIVEWTASKPLRGGAGPYTGGLRPLAHAGHAAVVLGITNRALIEISKIAMSTKRHGAEVTIRENPLFQNEFGLKEAAYKAARAYLFEVAEEMQERMFSGEEPREVDLARMLQAAIWAHQTCGDVMKFCFTWGGSRALRIPNTLARCMKNLYTGMLHVIIDPVLMVYAAPPILDEWAAWEPGQ